MLELLVAFVHARTVPAVASGMRTRERERGNATSGIGLAVRTAHQEERALLSFMRFDVTHRTVV